MSAEFNQIYLYIYIKSIIIFINGLHLLKELYITNINYMS